MIKKIINKILSPFRDDLYIDGKLYMKRWRFLPDWMPGFRVHNILISDIGPELHDHPFSFVTIVLRGGYYEHLSDGSREWHGAGSILFRQAKTMHRLELAKHNYSLTEDYRGAFIVHELLPAWTFVVRTSYFRQWGFAHKLGWMHHKLFTTLKRKNENSNIAM